MTLKASVNLAVFLVLALTFSQNAFCTLGEKFEATNSGGLTKKMTQKTQTFSVQESVVNGTTLHEYVLPDGTVFGVTWKGMKHPDLSQVLGTYKSEYDSVKAKQVKAVGRAPLNVKSSKVSVRMSGHMRDVHGEAYDPTLLPTGFTPQDFK